MKKVLLVLILIVTLAGCKKAEEQPTRSVVEVLEDAGIHAILLASGDVYIEDNGNVSKVPVSDVRQIASWHGEIWMVKNSGEIVVKDDFSDDAPYLYAGLSDVEKVVMGRGEEKFAITKDGSLFDLESFSKIAVKKVVDVVEFGTGSFIALTKKGELWGWGRNISAYNILAQQGVTEVKEPVKLPVKKVQKLCASKDVALALCKNGDLYAWGGNGSLQMFADDIMGRINKPKKIYKKVADVNMQTGYNNQDFSYAAILLESGEIELLSVNDQIQADALSGISNIYSDGAAIYAISESGELRLRGHNPLMDTSVLSGVKSITPPRNTKSSYYEGIVFFDTNEGWYVLEHSKLGEGFRRVLGLFEEPCIASDHTAWVSDNEYLYIIEDAELTALAPLQP